MMANHVIINRFPKLSYSANEAMNTLATNLSYCGDDIHVIQFTSRSGHEGKSFVTMNLLRTVAGLQKKVVLLDADLRRSHLVHSYGMAFGTETVNGLAQYLAGMCRREDILYETDIPGAWFIPIGRQVEGSLQLLSKPGFGELVAYLKGCFDLVLIDTPPAGTLIDAIEIAKYCDGAVIVVGSGMGNKNEITDVADAITRTGCPVLGMVMNRVDMKNFTNKKYYYSRKYYGYYGAKKPYTATPGPSAPAK